MKAKDISDIGMKNIVYETIKSGVNEWIRAAAYLRKNTGVDPLELDQFFDDRYRCNKRIVSRLKDLREAESFFKGETYEFYAKTLDSYIEPNRLLRELNKRSLELALK